MKITSVIGTRPQYIKLKPIYEKFKNSSLNHRIIDTSQHYDEKVSKNIIEDLGIKIDFFLENNSFEEINFICSTLLKLQKLLSQDKPDILLAFGDTNSTFCASLIAHKLGIKLAHVEAGERSGTKIPEEINRLYCDSISDIHFCSSKRHTKFVTNPVLTGDLEYELLHSYNPEVFYKNHALLTLHRQENMKKEKLLEFFEFLSKLKIDVLFPVHHRTKKFIETNDIKIPNFIKILDSFSYSEMVKQMAECKFIITDSGGVHKCSPYFGKKSLILREGNEWFETYERGFSKKYSSSDDDIFWLLDSIIERDKNFYLPCDKMPSQIILEKMYESTLL